MPNQNRVPLEGSSRLPLAGARRVGDADPDQQLSVTVIVRRRTDASQPPTVPPTSGPADQRRQLRSAFAAAQGADPADMDRVNAFADEHGLSVDESDQARRSIVLSGTVAAMSAAFGVDLGRYERNDLSYRGREGRVHLPADLEPIVDGVFGLDDRPQASPDFKIGPALDNAAAELAGMAARPEATGDTPFWPPEVAKMYGFPSDVVGTGETIAILELGGGYHDEELAKYFAKLKVPAPRCVAVGLDGAGNHPGEDADGEVLLDIEVTGSIAPGAEIVVYFAPNTDRGFLDALTTAVHSQERPASVVSISWGAPEAHFTDQARKAFDSAFADASALGVTVFCAAGDHGSGDAARDGSAHVDFPASSPNAVACGGTRLRSGPDANVEEVVWNNGDGWATGGGMSDKFSIPAYQQGLEMPQLHGAGSGRGVPDVAGNADSNTGYLCMINGQVVSIGGTSAVAPLYAALFALLGEALGQPIGGMPSRLYTIAGSPGTNVFRDITDGDNGVPDSQFGPATAGYSAGKGWDACTGLGSLNGSALLEALR
ncbi:MAG: S53 family peptidase [Acidimicrobiales bacterium]